MGRIRPEAFACTLSASKYHELHAATRSGNNTPHEDGIPEMTGRFPATGGFQECNRSAKMESSHTITNVIIGWNFIQCNVITNCFVKHGFGTKGAQEIEFEQDHPDWAELQGKMDCPTNS